jgi:hypothetical protein
MSRGDSLVQSQEPAHLDLTGWPANPRGHCSRIERAHGNIVGWRVIRCVNCGPSRVDPIQ